MTSNLERLRSITTAPLLYLVAIYLGAVIGLMLMDFMSGRTPGWNHFLTMVLLWQPVVFAWVGVVVIHYLLPTKHNSEVPT